MLGLIQYGAEDIRITGGGGVMYRTTPNEDEIIRRKQDELYELEHDPPTILVKIGCGILGIFAVWMLFHGVPPPFFGGQRIPRRKRTEREISEIVLKKSLIIT